jgi:hypothetical protein
MQKSVNRPVEIDSPDPRLTPEQYIRLLSLRITDRLVSSGMNDRAPIDMVRHARVIEAYLKTGE